MILTDDQLIARAIRAYHQRKRGKFAPENCSVLRTADGAVVTLRCDTGVVLTYGYHADLNRMARLTMTEPTPEEHVRALLARLAAVSA